MKDLRNFVLSILCLLPVMFCGCKDQSTTNGGGFAVSTASRLQSASGKLSAPQPIPDATVWGTYTGSLPNQVRYGSVQSYSGLEGTDEEPVGGCPEMPVEYQHSLNYYWVYCGLAPATWTVSWSLDFHCGDTNLIYSGPSNTGQQTWTYQIQNAEVFLTKGIEGDCLTKDVPNASTRFAILGQLPKTLTLSREALFTTTYGMPQLYVYNGTATLVATETATSVSSDGLQATFPFPSTLTQNGYSVAVANQTSGSPGISTVGTNYLSIASSQTIAGNPFGVSVGAQTDAYEQCTTGVIGGTSQTVTPEATIPTKCSISLNYLTFPVISLYSKNQVLINGTAVAVGQNPTAVVT